MTEKKLNGRGAIVTGGALGIGGGTARRLAAGGARVLIVDVVEEAAESNAKRIRDAGGTAVAMTGDVSSESVAESMVERAMDEFGRLDILVQNAYGGGAERAGSAVEVKQENWQSGMDLLVTALYLGAKYAVPAMEQSGSAPGFDSGSWSGAGLRHGEPPKMNVGRIVAVE